MKKLQIQKRENRKVQNRILLSALVLFIILFINLSIAQELTATNLENPVSETIQPPIEKPIIQKENTNPAQQSPTIKEKPLTHKSNSKNQNGNRLKKIEYRNGNTSNNETTYYFNSRPVDFIQVRNSSGIFNFSYYYMNDKLVASKMQGKQMLYYHGDHLGSTTLVTNQSGGVVENDVYLPFGGIYSGTASSKYLFTGKERDDGTGFDYFGARYYSSQFMHFMQPDKIKNIYDPQNLNSYAYVLNNPYKYVDKDGNFAFLVPVVIFVTSTAPVWAPVLYQLSVQQFIESSDQFRANPSLENALWTGLGAEDVLTPGVPEGTLAKQGVEAAENILNKVGKETADQTSSGLQSFTKNNFREHVGKDIGQPLSKTEEAHHNLPQSKEFSSQFEAAGFPKTGPGSIHDPKFGSAVEKTEHRQTAYNYNKAFAEFFAKNGRATRDQIIKFGRDTSRRFGFKPRF